MSEPYAKHKGTGKQELILIDGLQAINCLLKQLPNVTELNMPMKNYMKQIREMTYALEDFVDDLMIQFVSKNDISFSIRRVIGYPQKNAVLQKFINQIQKLRTQLEADLGSIMDKTKMVAAFGPSYMVTTEPQLSTVRDEESGIVGMDGPQDELVKWLIGVKQDQLQVVCIFGLAGIGKTTLATQVYNKIKWQFDCRVFIPVSKKTCVTRLLQNILSQLRWDPEIYDCHNNEDIINEIQRDLQDKRYLYLLLTLLPNRYRFSLFYYFSIQLVENGAFILVPNSLWSRFLNRDRESGTKGPDPLVPSQITGTKAPAQGKKIFCTTQESNSRCLPSRVASLLTHLHSTCGFEWDDFLLN
jgi:disease resistance protein RPM1